ncbi:restriction endonuclease subunit S [Faecalibacterium sp. OM04-11BH]|uniref:restriction endonuclease subunit S n=1 Tax=Faecalibacterium sp. OM04-11BH TaxID=2292357 RepID=UPI000E4A7BA1|nr:restriction endonuclease subunit S [Faecalibacterium sp. OM04-11BH]RHV53829.1 restriction endonuclease subunit S [Faecalibacterium sp. OM04-11BH]
MARLGDICTVNMGQSPDSATYNEVGRGLPFFQGNADFGRLHPAARVWCSEPTKIAHTGDILISVRAPIGAMNVADQDCCIGRGLAAIQVNENICDPQYLWYAIQSKVSDLNAKGTGSTFKAISKSTLTDTEVLLVPLDAQKNIARVLSNVENSILFRKEQLSKLDELVKARFVEMFGEPGAKNENWPQCTLGKACKINPKKSEDIRLQPNLEVSFVPMPAVTENGKMDSSIIKIYDEVKTGFTYFSERDVLFAKITPCMENGKGAVAVNLKNEIGFGSTEFHVIRPIAEKTNPYWIYALTVFEKFRKDAAKNMTGSAGQRRVPASFLENYQISLPPIDLQNQFADFVAEVDKSKVGVQKALDQTQLLFDSLMQQYFG